MMNRFNRRTVLKGATWAAASSGLGLLPIRSAHAWGEFNFPSSVWPSGAPDTKILEIFLYGGLSAWETFYHRPTLADPWRGFGPDIMGLSWGCSDTPWPGLETRFFANDALGQAVHLGPFTKPLWPAHISDRMRIIALRHDLEPHEAAIPYALSGLRLGRPNLSGLGAPIQRFNLETSPRPLPYSFVCVPRVFSFPSDNLQATTAIGVHPGYARPLTLRIGAGTDTLVTMLGRSNMSSTADALLDQYRAQYRDQLRWIGAGEPIRSKAFAAYDSSAASVLNAASLQTLLSSAPLALGTDEPCAHVVPPPTPIALDNMPGTAIRVAAYLLTRPAAQAARYVCVVDSGLREAAGGGGYDTHSSGHAVDTAVNLWNTLSTLSDVIQDPGLPPAPGKIDLNTTLIILTTEFGRTTARNGDGRDHHPAGYVNLMIGGPIATPGISGAIFDSGLADPMHVFSPTDVRAAALVAAGMNPFADGIYALGDISNSLRNSSPTDGHERSAVRIRRELLGRSFSGDLT